MAPAIRLYTGSIKKMYDLTTIKRISKDDKTVIARYIQTFIDNTLADLQTIDNLMAESLLENVAEVLHKMKTSVAYFGMSDVEQLVISTEKAIREEAAEKAAVKERIKEINGLLTESFRMLREELVQLQASQ